MEDLSLHILDVVENSVSADATLVSISIHADCKANILELEISDNGRGMDRELLEAVKSPFVTSRTTRNVGLGLPMLAQSAENTGGKLEIESQPGKGTTVKTSFQLDHIDRIPFGDLERTLMTLIVGNDSVDFVFRYQLDDEAFSLDTRDLKRHFGDEPFYKPLVLKALRKLLKDGLGSLDIEASVVRSSAMEKVRSEN